MGITTLVVIVLAVLLLAFLIWGIFLGGLKPLIDKLSGYGGGEVNIGEKVHGCQIACSSGSDYDYCVKKGDKIVFDKVDGKENPDNGYYSCEQLAKGFNIGLNECGLVVCESGCSDLEFEECQYEEDGKCVVEWVGRPSFEKHERMVSGGELREVVDITSKVSFEEADKKGDGWICEKRVLN